MTAHENNGIQGAMSKKGRANLGSAFLFSYLFTVLLGRALMQAFAPFGPGLWPWADFAIEMDDLGNSIG
jgi:hypothetical protein